ncbi:general secretion pathway protein [Rhodobacterales bacterium 52_120_T64]|nr:general secretion pathway protein [Rhodobacterales bacterium 52_120_T64]
MKFNDLIKASLFGLALTLPTVSPVSAQSGLSVMRGSVSSNITVATNRAIVVQSDQPFAEISVANPGIADIATLSESTIYVLGKAPGRTTLTLFGVDGDLIANVDVRVVPDIAEFKERLAEILPGEPIEVRTAGGGIVLSGTVSGARKVARAMELASRYAGDQVTNLMMVGGSQQVLLKVRFAEMSRSTSKSLSSAVGLTRLSSPTGERFFDSATGEAAFSFGAGGLAVDVLIEALESKGMVRTLAEPNVVAISGKQASFFAGGEYPVPDADGGYVFKQFGVELIFTPTVIDDNMISLNLNTVVNAIDTAVVGVSTNAEDNATTSVPGFTTRSTSTTVEMRDGQSFAIAGLLQDDFNDVVGQVPWLGDVPILGALFRSSEFTRKQTELVIIITPHLVRAVSGEALSMPTDRMRVPTEEELFLLGAVEGSSSLDGSSSQSIQGSFGYVLE